MGFFKKDDIQEKEAQATGITRIETNKIENKVSKRKDLSLFDVDTIQYVIENFPAMSVEIQAGLNDLAEILENTIDYIEDKSSEIIKKNRDFKVSKAYRDTSIAIYDVVQNIGKYIMWMQDEYEKNMKNENGNIEQRNEVLKSETHDDNKEEENEKLNDKIAFKEEIKIYKDFSLKEPKAFKVDDNLVMVEDWDDLLVKTAEVLTKLYRGNKNRNKFIKDIKIVEKKSTQNSFRDTVIEMLNEYKVNLDEFSIIIK